MGAVAVQALDAHFMRFVDTSGACWTWTGGTDKDGYGIYRPPMSRRKYRAHRYSLFGSAKTSRWALHACDNPRCVNPAHLFPGDAKGNYADMATKGRRGQTGKLTSAQVQEAVRRWRDGERQADIAASMGVSQPAISHHVRAAA